MPYYYRIRHIASGKYYIGCRYSKRAHIDDFFKSYFTSSYVVKNIIKEEGISAFEILKVIPIIHAREFEFRVLNRLYHYMGRTKFIEVFLNRKINKNIILDKAAIEKLKLNKARIEKIELAKLGNKNVRGKFWWNNGVIMKRSFISPGDDWVRGALKHSEETKKKRSASHKGKILSEETKKKQSIARKNEKHGGSHRGTIWVINEDGVKKRVMKDNIPEGFKRN